jgi:hypothetical protein
MLPVNTFKKRITFDFLNSRGSDSMFPFTAESEKDRLFSILKQLLQEKKGISFSSPPSLRNGRNGRKQGADPGNNEKFLKNGFIHAKKSMLSDTSKLDPWLSQRWELPEEKSKFLSSSSPSCMSPEGSQNRKVDSL